MNADLCGDLLDGHFHFKSCLYLQSCRKSEVFKIFLCLSHQ